MLGFAFDHRPRFARKSHAFAHDLAAQIEVGDILDAHRRASNVPEISSRRRYGFSGEVKSGLLIAGGLAFLLSFATMLIYGRIWAPVTVVAAEAARAER
ncbi:hypothetical protein [Burkholderia sp. Ac-20379]|uniref:hypothetical protein n=1 Tax=Burkholderia sp. Ac-20379 TaxID=2703900 RepID=UPI00197DD35D|nr:hypothetical protein [Burkholderia sp. Ac-20379]MBN3723132.1 hypothetical protein [Burkholderia sp. Ac-20379]